jgi:hypothetical protein
MINFTSTLAFTTPCFVAILWALTKKNRKNKEREEDREILLNCPFARARANAHFHDLFGILNSFVSPCAIVRKEFRREMIGRKLRLENCEHQLRVAASLTHFICEYFKCMCLPSSILHPSSSFILHPPSSFILLHPSSSFILLHPPSSSFVLHPPSPFILLRPSSSFVLHPSSLILNP